MAIENLSPESLVPGESYKVYVRAETISSRVIFEDERRIEFRSKSLSIVSYVFRREGFFFSLCKPTRPFISPEPKSIIVSWWLLQI